MGNRIPYKNFSSYVLRSPLLTFDFYKQITAKEHISDEQFKGFCSDVRVKEAIFLASPALSNAINRWINGEIENVKDVDKLKFSILKYLSRMSSRCTPFGLFAGCSIGTFSDETNISLNSIEDHKRHTRLDMNYLVALSQDLTKIEHVKKQLLFFPNTSIYKIANQLRYIEYKYIKGKRYHYIISVDHTSYLDQVLTLAKTGAKLKDLANVLVCKEVTEDEAYGYVEQLVSNQLLVSEFEPSVSGPEFLDQIFSVLSKLENVETIIQKLNTIRNQLKTIDNTLGNDTKTYQEVIALLNDFETDTNPKFMFQTDMILGRKTNTLDKNIIRDIQNGLRLLNKINAKKRTSSLTKFRDAFYERFEENEVPLSQALDTEIGLGYKQNQGHGDINPLVDNLVLESKKTKYNVREIKWSPIHDFLQKKLIEAYQNNAFTITISKRDFENIEENWDDLPDTFSCMIEILEIEGKQKIKFDGYGGSSAANLLGRFCHGDKEMKQLVQEISDVESKINSNKIIAEIVHLPESRVGNILMRPNLREYEIPYLAKSLRPEQFQLPIDDLMISIKNNTDIVLRSKTHNKEVIPRLSNAHNYSHNSLPIYHFLCDLQTQQIRSEMWFDYGPLSENYEFLPRVEYNNLILHEATWYIKKNRIDTLLKNENDDDKLKEAVNQLRFKLNIPKYVLLADGDNQLLVNFENLTSVKMLLNLVNKRTEFQLKEFLSVNNNRVKQDTQYCTNQIIVSFYNERKLKK
ncbi:lantibiotic dehydratase family protein [Psychroserpens luteolus]|uniref:lantibiotic dehydratase family protein n=1 Tax=Psychroserpens luteolus TaxID=2855840 RepID=UPI001E4E3B73|nr:lantibiotic dehydratase family protein [Psychroserpens luteolus]MCD2258057.1 lantibiotic dehydratase family protein [Psychroserpens luteolus]